MNLSYILDSGISMRDSSTSLYLKSEIKFYSSSDIYLDNFSANTITLIMINND